MKFYLGTHRPSWLGQVDFPLFISRNVMPKRYLPRATTDWALDSGAFSELSRYGQWTITPRQYVALVRRYRDEIGYLQWAAPMDWMCEPFMLSRTGLSVAEHQLRTIENYLTLRELAPDLPFVPVLQGWTLDDYLAHVDVYAAFCVDLTVEPTVGVGSVCRRQDTAEIDAILSHLASRGLALHGFGVKTLGLRTYSRTLTSADSMAWSYRGRHEPGCRPGHKNEANCLTFARTWREGVLRGATFQQLAFGEA